MKRAHHFVETTRTLRNSKCYVDQWEKRLALVDAKGQIIMAITEGEMFEYPCLNVAIATGEQYKFFCARGDIAYIGSMKRDSETLCLMEAITWVIMKENSGRLVPIPDDEVDDLSVYDFLPDTRVGFHPTNNNEAAYYTEKAKEIVISSKSEDIGDIVVSGYWKERYDYYRGWEHNYGPLLSYEFQKYVEESDDDYCTMSGGCSEEWDFPMYDVGDGVYCDDDGDNWDFY